MKEDSLEDLFLKLDAGLMDPGDLSEKEFNEVFWYSERRDRELAKAARKLQKKIDSGCTYMLRGKARKKQGGLI